MEARSPVNRFPEEEKTDQKRSKKLDSEKGANGTSFDELSDDMRISIFRRLNGKDRGKFKCVSKDWCRLIAMACFPIYYGLLYKYERMNGPYAEHIHMSYEPLSGKLCSHGSFVLDDFKNLVFQLQESCNGLLLLCHAFSKRLLRSWIYRYYVVNPLTKQHVVIHTPKPISGLYKYAALVYHPAESSHFKIVRFCIKYLHIYSSETGRWSKSRMLIKDDNISRAKKVRQSVYFKGAIYRLSMSGHILRFFVNKETGKPWMVQEIEIPGTAKINEAACIGPSNEHIRFAMSADSSLKIWELNHQLSDWSLKFSCPVHQINKFYEHPRPLTFFPHLDAIILGYVDYNSRFVSFECLRYSESEEMSQSRQCLTTSRWQATHKFVFPLFQCEAPFASDTAK